MLIVLDEEACNGGTGKAEAQPCSRHHQQGEHETSVRYVEQKWWGGDSPTDLSPTSQLTDSQLANIASKGVNSPTGPTHLQT